MTVPIFSTIAKRPVDDLEASGILWAVNRYVFHPRGFALVPTALGLELHGDGREPFVFPPDYDDASYRSFEDFLNAARASELLR